jgi:hypothetical protein
MKELFEIVNSLATPRVSSGYDTYADWCEGNGWEPEAPQTYRYEMSEIEQKWVIFDVMQRQISDDQNADTVSSEHILKSLQDVSFAPSFETIIEPLCERVLTELQRASTS